MSVDLVSSLFWGFLCRLGHGCVCGEDCGQDGYEDAEEGEDD